LAVGRVLRPHGLRGEVRVEIHTDAPERFASYERLYLAPVAPGGSALMSGEPVPRALQGHRFHQGKVLLKLEGVDDRNQAEELRDQWVWISIEDAVPLEEGEVYLHQMLHLRVVTAEGEPLGEIAEIIETGANFVYVVHGARGEILVPDTEEVVLEVDTEARQMTVHLIDGLV
jgi:16S rRNA processing protein RimM